MLGSCLRDSPLSRRSPLCLSDSACQCDRTPLVWHIRTRRQCIEPPGGTFEIALVGQWIRRAQSRTIRLAIRRVPARFSTVTKTGVSQAKPLILGDHCTPVGCAIFSMTEQDHHFTVWN